MIDLSKEQAQFDRPPLPIPNNSLVLVKLTLRKPTYPSQVHHLVLATKGGLLGLDGEFEVTAGSYTGAKIWENLWLPADLQNIQLSTGHQTACKIAGAKMKAMVEAARKIDPKDESPNANQQRMIQDWSSLSGMYFGVRVGVKTEPNDKGYYNNFIRSIITPDHEHYDYIARGGEMISDEPVPLAVKQRQDNSGNSYTPPDEDIPF